MVSEKIFHVLNNEYTAYGLKEYETKSGEPVRLIVAIHDIGSKLLL
jgi:CRISPR/Cas system-associated endonuclease Cas3-HD